MNVNKDIATETLQNQVHRQRKKRFGEKVRISIMCEKTSIWGFQKLWKREGEKKIKK